MSKNNKKIIAILFVIVTLGSCITASIIRISKNRIIGIEAAEMICQNLIEHDMIDSRDECVIADYHHDYMPSMFPLNKVNRTYVDAGMDGFGLSFPEPNSRYVRYGLYRDWLGQPRRPWVEFHFNEIGVLVEMSFSD